MKRYLAIAGLVCMNLVSCYKSEPDLSGWWKLNGEDKIEFVKTSKDTYKFSDAFSKGEGIIDLCGSDLSLNKSGDLTCIDSSLHTHTVFHYNDKDNTLTTGLYSTMNSKNFVLTR